MGWYSAVGRPLFFAVSPETAHRLAQAMLGLDDVPADLHGSSSYRTRVGATMVARAWAEATAEARGG